MKYVLAAIIALKSARRKILGLREVTSISLHWGSHRDEHAISGYIKEVFLEHSPEEAMRVNDPVIDEYIHRHVFSDRSIYRLRSAVFNPVSGGVYLDKKLVRESQPNNPSQIIKRNATFGRNFDGPVIGVQFQTHYHWLIETLPRVIAAALHEPNATLVAPTCLMDTQRQAIETLGLEVHYSDLCHLSDDFVFASRGEDSGWAHPDDLDLLRQTYAVPTAPGSLPLFVSRVGSRRGDSLSHEILSFAEQSGWIIVQAEKLTWEEHLRIFGQASVIVGEHGAGLANLALAPLGTQMIELSRSDYANPCFAALSLALNGNGSKFLRYSRESFRQALIT